MFELFQHFLWSSAPPSLRLMPSTPIAPDQVAFCLQPKPKSPADRLSAMD